MPIFAKLISFVATTAFGWVAYFVGAAWAVRISAALSIAAIYISCVVYYTEYIALWIGTVFSTAYGQLLGLLFPPVSGTVMVGIFTYWTCIVGKRYISMLTKLVVG